MDNRNLYLPQLADNGTHITDLSVRNIVFKVVSTMLQGIPPSMQGIFEERVVQGIPDGFKMVEISYPADTTVVPEGGMIPVSQGLRRTDEVVIVKRAARTAVTAERIRENPLTLDDLSRSLVAAIVSSSIDVATAMFMRAPELQTAEHDRFKSPSERLVQICRMSGFLDAPVPVTEAVVSTVADTLGGRGVLMFTGSGFRAVRGAREGPRVSIERFYRSPVTGTSRTDERILMNEYFRFGTVRAALASKLFSPAARDVVVYRYDTAQLARISFADMTAKIANDAKIKIAEMDSTSKVYYASCAIAAAGIDPCDPDVCTFLENGRRINFTETSAVDASGLIDHIASVAPIPAAAVDEYMRGASKWNKVRDFLAIRNGSTSLAAFVGAANYTPGASMFVQYIVWAFGISKEFTMEFLREHAIPFPYDVIGLRKVMMRGSAALIAAEDAPIGVIVKTEPIIMAGSNSANQTFDVSGAIRIGGKMKQDAWTNARAIHAASVTSHIHGGGGVEDIEFMYHNPTNDIPAMFSLTIDATLPGDPAKTLLGLAAIRENFIVEAGLPDDLDALARTAIFSGSVHFTGAGQTPVLDYNQDAPRPLISHLLERYGQGRMA